MAELDQCRCFLLIIKQKKFSLSLIIRSSGCLTSVFCLGLTACMEHPSETSPLRKRSPFLVAINSSAGKQSCMPVVVGLPSRMLFKGAGDAYQGRKPDVVPLVHQPFGGTVGTFSDRRNCHENHRCTLQPSNTPQPILLIMMESSFKPIFSTEA